MSKRHKPKQNSSHKVETFLITLNIITAIINLTTAILLLVTALR